MALLSPVPKASGHIQKSFPKMSVLLLSKGMNEKTSSLAVYPLKYMHLLKVGLCIETATPSRYALNMLRYFEIAASLIICQVASISSLEQRAVFVKVRLEQEF